MLQAWHQNANERMRKGEKNRKEERATKPEMNREQKLVGTARERTTTPSENSMDPLQIKPKTNNSICN
jgi:hypothetical protein